MDNISHPTIFGWVWDKSAPFIAKTKEWMWMETLFKICGLWHDQSEICRKIIFCIHQLNIVSLIVALAAGLTENCSTEITIIYENIICMTYLAAAAINYTILYIKRDQVQKLYQKFVSDYKKKPDNDSPVLHAYIRKGRLINNIYMVYGLSALILAACVAFYLTSRNSLENKCAEYFPYYYRKFIIYPSYGNQQVMLHIFAAYLSTMFCYFMASAVFVILTTYVCGLYAIARHRLENVADFSDERPSVLQVMPPNWNSDDAIISNLENVINKHNKAVETVQQIESTFSPIIGVLQIGSLECFGFTIYEALCHAGTNFELLRSTNLLLVYISYVFIFNWTGQEVLNICEAFFISCYTTTWYTLPIKAKKLLLTVQLRASKFEQLTAASVFILSLNNFGWMLQSSWSISAVLTSSQNKSMLH